MADPSSSPSSPDVVHISEPSFVNPYPLSLDEAKAFDVEHALDMSSFDVGFHCQVRQLFAVSLSPRALSTPPYSFLNAFDAFEASKSLFDASLDALESSNSLLDASLDAFESSKNLFAASLDAYESSKSLLTPPYEHSTPYEHEKNGSSEKTFRDLGDLARTMMATSSSTS